MPSTSDANISEPRNNGFVTPSIPAILAQLKTHAQDNKDELRKLESLDDFFHNPGLQALIEVYEKINDDTQSAPLPKDSNVLGILLEVHELSRVFSDNEVLSELSDLLKSSSHLLALLASHDRVAAKDYGEPYLSDSTENVTNDEGSVNEESMKVVRLVKADEPLGATIATDEKTGNIVIARILKGGAADRSGLIHINDIVVEVNGKVSQGKKPEELIEELAGFRGPLTFKLIPGESTYQAREENMFLRAKFSFTPSADPLIPCAEAGVSFVPGDILKVASKDDSSWWQAAKVDKKLPLQDLADISTSRAGLIPSMKLQIRREKLKKQATLRYNTASPSMKGSNTSLLSNHRKTAWSVIRASFRKKRGGNLNNSLAANPKGSKLEEPYFQPYEVVSQTNPTRGVGDDCFTPRPIVLVGPQGVGRNELKDRLIDSNPSHYGVPVPHTSRPKQPDEVDAQDYHFVTREFMENGIRENMFLEYGEYRRNLYGTSLESVRVVMRSQQVCVLTPYPQALSMLRTREFRPYVVFVKPPSVEQMRFSAGGSGEDYNNGTNPTDSVERTLPFSEHELKGLIQRGEKLEQTYGRLFDYCIVNDDIERSFAELKDVLFAVENDPQWVPADWIP